MLDLDDEHSEEFPAKLHACDVWVRERIRLSFASAAPWKVALTFQNSDGHPIVIGLSHELITEVLECTHQSETISCLHQAGIGDIIFIANRPQRQPGYGAPIFALQVSCWDEDDAGVTQYMTMEFRLSLRSVVRFMARVQKLVPQEQDHLSAQNWPYDGDLELLLLAAASM